MNERDSKINLILTRLRDWGCTLDESTGRFIKPDGKAAGKIKRYKYNNRWIVRIKHRQVEYYEYNARLVFLVTNGYLPDEPDTIDHINGDSMDDRPCNLRVLSRSDNTLARWES